MTVSQENMAAKTGDPGRHKTSATFGMVYSDHDTDKAGNGPKDFAKMFERRMGRESSEQAQPQQGQARPAQPQTERRAEPQAESEEHRPRSGPARQKPK